MFPNNNFSKFELAYHSKTKMLEVIIVVTIIVVIYFKVVKPMTYWKLKNVPYIKPWPFFGNMASVFFRLKPAIEIIDDFYNTNPNLRYIGIYEFRKPALLICDPELIKTICVKNFDCFPEHRTIVPKGCDPLWTYNIFAMQNEDGWREKRSKLSPAFTNNKMKLIFPLIQRCALQLKKYIQVPKTREVDIKEAVSRYATDVLAVAIFGITCNSFENPKNEFYTALHDATTINDWQLLKIFGYSEFSSLMEILKVPVFSKKVTTTLNYIVSKTLKIQEENNNVKEANMINLLMKELADDKLLKENIDSPNKNGQVSTEDISILFMAFLLAGFETASSVIAYTFYELAVNDNVQKTLLEEIDQILAESNYEITYEAIMKMKYLDMIISESLRKWTPSPATDRQCTRTFTIEPIQPGEKRLKLDAGTGIWIPIHAIHHDHRYFPEPEKFDPERFSPENKLKITPYTYNPFGIGPRSCIGSRLFLVESKLLIVEILQTFKVIAVNKTQIPIQFSKKNLHPLPDNGIWVGFKQRKI